MKFSKNHQIPPNLVKFWYFSGFPHFWAAGVLPKLIRGRSRILQSHSLTSSDPHILRSSDPRILRSRTLISRTLRSHTLRSPILRPPSTAHPNPTNLTTCINTMMCFPPTNSLMYTHSRPSNSSNREAI